MLLRDFESRIERITETGCWIWMGPCNPAGYGRFFDQGVGRHVSAHRVSWQFAHGPIPLGMFVCHRCDVPTCVNPAHLFLGTNRDNALDCIRKGRHPGTARHPRALVENRRDRIRATKIADPSLTLSQLASMFSCSPTTVQKACASIAPKNHGRYARLSERDVLMIRYRALVLGESRAALGREFRLSGNYVFHIISGKRWSRLPFPKEMPA